MKIKRGSTSVRRLIFIADSSSTTGAGLTSLVFNTSGLVAYYFAGDLSNEVQITLATATLGTFTSGGFVAVDNTNMPGWYEIGIPDAALDGGNEVCIQLRGATNMVPVNLHIELDAFDYQTATQPVNVTQFGGSDLTSAAGIPEVKVQSIANNAITAASIADGAIDTATFTAGTTLPRVTLVDTCTTLTNLPTIPTNWLTAAGLAADAATEIGAAVLSALGTGTWATAIPWNAAWDPEVQSECADALNAYDPPTKAELDTAVTGLATGTNVTDAVTSIKGADGDTLKTLSDQIDLTATAANQTKTLDRLGYIMAQEIGACADAGTSAESYTITIDTTTYTIDHTGLDATGNRGTATLTKS